MSTQPGPDSFAVGSRGKASEAGWQSGSMSSEEVWPYLSVDDLRLCQASLLHSAVISHREHPHDVEHMTRLTALSLHISKMCEGQTPAARCTFPPF